MSAPPAFSDPGAIQDLAYAVQLLIGAVFLASALPKLRNVSRFRATVARYEVLPATFVGPVSLAVIAAELLLAASFIGGLAVVAGLTGASALLAAFAAATWINLRRGRDIECGCFGGADERITSRSLARLAILGIAVAALAVSLAIGSATAVSPAWLDARGAHARYLVEIAWIGVALTLLTAWLLEAPKLRGVMLGPSPHMSSRPGPGVNGQRGTP